MYGMRYTPSEVLSRGVSAHSTKGFFTIAFDPQEELRGASLAAISPKRHCYLRSFDLVGDHGRGNMLQLPCQICYQHCSYVIPRSSKLVKEARACSRLGSHDTVLVFSTSTRPVYIEFLKLSSSHLSALVTSFSYPAIAHRATSTTTRRHERRRERAQLPGPRHKQPRYKHTTSHIAGVRHIRFPCILCTYS